MMSKVVLEASSSPSMEVMPDQEPAQVVVKSTADEAGKNLDQEQAAALAPVPSGEKSASSPVETSPLPLETPAPAAAATSPPPTVAAVAIPATKGQQIFSPLLNYRYPLASGPQTLQNVLILPTQQLGLSGQARSNTATGSVLLFPMYTTAKPKQGAPAGLSAAATPSASKDGTASSSPPKAAIQSNFSASLMSVGAYTPYQISVPSRTGSPPRTVPLIRLNVASGSGVVPIAIGSTGAPSPAVLVPSSPDSPPPGGTAGVKTEATTNEKKNNTDDERKAEKKKRSDRKKKPEPAPNPVPCVPFSSRRKRRPDAELGLDLADPLEPKEVAEEAAVPREEKEQKAASPAADADIAFADLRDVIQAALLAQPDGVASLGGIYNFCEHWPHLLAPDGGDYRSVVEMRNWKSAIRNCLQSVPIFRRGEEEGTWRLVTDPAPPPPQVTGGKKDLQAVLAEARAMPVVVGRVKDGKLIRPKEKKSGRKITVRERSLRSLLLFLAEAHTRQESTSELTEVDLREIVTAESWAKLSAEEQASLLPMLPEIDRSEKGLEYLFSRSHVFFTSAMQLYQRMLKAGSFDPHFAEVRNTVSKRLKEREREKGEHWSQALARSIDESLRKKPDSKSLPKFAASKADTAARGAATAGEEAQEQPAPMRTEPLDAGPAPALLRVSSPSSPPAESDSLLLHSSSGSTGQSRKDKSLRKRREMSPQQLEPPKSQNREPTRRQLMLIVEEAERQKIGCETPPRDLEIVISPKPRKERKRERERDRDRERSRDARRDEDVELELNPRVEEAHNADPDVAIVIVREEEEEADDRGLRETSTAAQRRRPASLAASPPPEREERRTEAREEKKAEFIVPLKKRKSLWTEFITDVPLIVPDLSSLPAPEPSTVDPADSEVAVLEDGEASRGDLPPLMQRTLEQTV